MLSLVVAKYCAQPAQTVEQLAPTTCATNLKWLSKSGTFLLQRSLINNHDSFVLISNHPVLPLFLDKLIIRKIKLLQKAYKIYRPKLKAESKLVA